MVQDIGVVGDGAVTNNHAKKLVSMSGELPPSTVITQVDGNRTEDISAWLTNVVEARSRSIAARVEVIRKFVADNAEALTNAVEALRARDELSATEARQTTELIDDAGTGKSLSTGAAAGAAAGRAATTQRTFGG